MLLAVSPPPSGPLVCLPQRPSHAQSGDGEAPSKRATIVRVADGAIRVDGRLDDPAWEQAPVVNDFTQKEPVEGAPATERMEVKFVYDDDALYVGARMYSRNRIGDSGAARTS